MKLEDVVRRELTDQYDELRAWVDLFLSRLSVSPSVDLTATRALLMVAIVFRANGIDTIAKLKHYQRTGEKLDES